MHFLVLITVHRKLKQPNPGRTKCSELSGMKVRVMPPGKEPRSAEVLAKNVGNTEWVPEESNCKYQLRTLQKITLYLK